MLEIGDGYLTAEAGATMIAMERAARKTGQQLWMYPSTTGSSIGGFLGGGSGGTGSIAHGSNDSGFVMALDVVDGNADARLIHLEGEQTRGYVHAYGVTGIIVRATVRLEPAQEWSSLYASFDTFAQALPAVRDLGRSTPSPRLVSADVPFVSAVLPPDPAIPHGRASLRAIVDPERRRGRFGDRRIGWRPDRGRATRFPRHREAEHAVLQPPDLSSAEGAAGTPTSTWKWAAKRSSTGSTRCTPCSPAACCTSRPRTPCRSGC